MKTGDKLPNGAIVIAEQHGIVLAMQPDSAQPFVTWAWDGEDPRSTMWGHYFSSIVRASDDYEERLNQRGSDARVA